MAPLSRPGRWPSPGLRGRVLLLLLFLPAGLSGQGEPRLDLEVEATTGSVQVRFVDLFADAGLVRSLEAGLPLRVQLVTELWRDRLFDAQEVRHEWRATLRVDPVGGGYAIETSEGETLRVATLPLAAERLQALAAVPVVPGRPGSRYYYLSRMEMETLSLSDLEELRRWLRGEMAPAIGSDGDVGGALGRGVLRLFVRALNLPVLRLEARTPTFTWAGR